MSQDGLATLTTIKETILWEEDGRLYTATTLLPRDSALNENVGIPDSVLNELVGLLVSEEAMSDRWEDNLQEAEVPLLPDTHEKRPNPALYDPEAHDTVWMTEEAKVYQFIQQGGRRHPNICEYRGAVRKGDYCVALALQSHETTLERAVDSGVKLNRRRIFEGILDGVKVSVHRSHRLLVT